MIVPQFIVKNLKHDGVQTAAEVWMDGRKLDSVRSISIDAGVGQCTIVTLELYADVNIEET